MNLEPGTSHSHRGIAEAIFRESAELKLAFLEGHLDLVVRVAVAIAKALRAGRKILIFGNGGSAADAQHIAGELVNRFLLDRPALPAIALTTDGTVLTSISNDRDYAQVFARQVEALGSAGDVAIGISTSGQSSSVVCGIETAGKMQLCTVAFAGGDGGKLAGLADYAFVVPSRSTPRIQEVHATLGHALCQLVETDLFGTS
ncbi:phosphoheptose isomerase [Candidatus Methylomirabilis limnetica]|uniref:Phosphoheptose isomerase n=1 Tax=Candidatus Methylomirabilis limnetica TaxID=2033718 RepID=A0A2T4TYD9_9BACT|nr:D-sedoheptulose 7-phosphate isomerase [Candidatus Methylomirabilis limnetica]PTL36132.1 phosphoheptose isomerase [Candidatus Methylomirabilis limnetica]